ncbi:subunit of tubulin prefoldin [Thelotrema lepadinum]|nr:subunit of tubulin prefoldin [Thelotrema lepadinum]
MASTATSEQEVQIQDLSLQQLSSVKKQLDDEVEHLTVSYSKLRAAQTRFRDCTKSIQNGVNAEMAGRPVLVPLTTSLYVPGAVAEPERVIVDVGTGFFVEKSTKDAIIFYDAKSGEIGKNLIDLEKIVQSKSANLRVVEDVLRHKVISSNSATPPQPAA